MFVHEIMSPASSPFFTTKDIDLCLLSAEPPLAMKYSLGLADSRCSINSYGMSLLITLLIYLQQRAHDDIQLSTRKSKCTFYHKDDIYIFLSWLQDLSKTTVGIFLLFPKTRTNKPIWVKRPLSHFFLHQNFLRKLMPECVATWNTQYLCVCEQAVHHLVSQRTGGRSRVCLAGIYLSEGFLVQFVP